MELCFEFGEGKNCVLMCCVVLGGGCRLIWGGSLAGGFEWVDLDLVVWDLMRGDGGWRIVGKDNGRD